MEGETILEQYKSAAEADSDEWMNVDGGFSPHIYILLSTYELQYVVLYNGSNLPQYRFSPLKKVVYQP